MNLTLQIEDIIEAKGSDFELSKLFKAYINEYKKSLEEIFEKNQGKDFLVKHTKKLDSILSLMYKTVLRQTFGNYIPMSGSIPIAIVALGSYGREQLCVHSDIDLLMVYEQIEGYNTKLIIEKLFYLALDSGLKLGHRVHEVSDLFKAACEDTTIRTALMESRFITGSSFTWHATQKALTKIRLHNQRDFIIAKIDEALMRRKKHPASMQPNIKESIGSLRDSQLLYWIAKTIYGVSSIKDLSGKLFSEDEYREYRASLELLFRVRSALHIITKKQEDRLLLEHMPQVAKMLGFHDPKKMASKVLQAQWTINLFTQVFVKKMVRPYLFEPSNVSKFRSSRVEPGIYCYANRLYTSFHMPKTTIDTLLSTLITLPDQPYSFDASFLHLFANATLPHPLRVQTFKLLKDLLKKKHTYSFLKLFYDAGLLHQLFSNFRKVMHLPQFDGYHHYPVDIHSIKSVASLESIQEPFINKIYQSLTHEEQLLLKIVVLFHDTGKGRKQDHSEVGAKLIVPFLNKLKFSDELIHRATLLVKHHILMSHVAFKENIHNEKSLYKFMSYIQDKKNLDLLYILTYADINGVGKDTYNSFNAKLLFDLYISAKEISQNADRITDATKRVAIEKRIQNDALFKILPKLLQTKLIRIESNLFFFKHSIEKMIEIATTAQEVKAYTYKLYTDESLSLEIYRKIPLNISYLLAKLSKLDVGSMDIFTLFDDVKYFKIDFTKKIEEADIFELEQIIENAFDMDRHVELKNISIKHNEIEIDCDHSITHAMLTLKTSNQIGLLAYIMSVFETLHINIVTAKIHSTKYRVNDIFLIEKKNKLCDNVAHIIELLTQGE